MLPQWTASFYPSLGLVVHRITKWLRLEEPSGANPLLQQGHLQQVTQDQVQIAFEYLQEGY